MCVGGLARLQRFATNTRPAAFEWGVRPYFSDGRHKVSSLTCSEVAYPLPGSGPRRGGVLQRAHRAVMAWRLGESASCEQRTYWLLVLLRG